MEIMFENGLVPVIIQDNLTRQVLMLGYMNEEAYQKTLEENRVTFFSRSKQRLWTKGETSGNFLNVVDIKVDCDGDALLIRATPAGPVCHTGTDTCWSERNEDPDEFNVLEETISDRIKNPREGSYTSDLVARGINKVAQKVGEEAVELVIEAKDDNQELFLNEAADLMYHLIVLLQAKGYGLDDVREVLRKRRKTS